MFGDRSLPVRAAADAGAIGTLDPAAPMWRFSPRPDERRSDRRRRWAVRMSMAGDQRCYRAVCDRLG